MARNTILTNTMWLEGIELFSGAGWTLFLNIGHRDPVRQKKKQSIGSSFAFCCTVTVGGTTMSSSGAETSGEEGLR